MIAEERRDSGAGGAETLGTASTQPKWKKYLPWIGGGILVVGLGYIVYSRSRSLNSSAPATSTGSSLGSPTSTGSSLGSPTSATPVSGGTSSNGGALSAALSQLGNQQQAAFAAQNKAIATQQAALSKSLTANQSSMQSALSALGSQQAAAQAANQSSMQSALTALGNQQNTELAAIAKSQQASTAAMQSNLTQFENLLTSQQAAAQRASAQAASQTAQVATQAAQGYLPTNAPPPNVPEVTHAAPTAVKQSQLVPSSFVAPNSGTVTEAVPGQFPISAVGNPYTAALNLNKGQTFSPTTGNGQQAIRVYGAAG